MDPQKALNIIYTNIKNSHSIWDLIFNVSCILLVFTIICPLGFQLPQQKTKGIRRFKLFQKGLLYKRPILLPMHLIAFRASYKLRSAGNMEQPQSGQEAIYQLHCCKMLTDCRNKAGRTQSSGTVDVAVMLLWIKCIYGAGKKFAPCRNQIDQGRKRVTRWERYK